MVQGERMHTNTTILETTVTLENLIMDELKT
jgi:hypothetical protein